MSATSRSLDDLDRLAFRLSRVIRAQYPQLATTGFTLIDLEERLLSFRETRREMADGGTESWERAVLRLLSGERDIVKAEPELREACRRALASPSPTLSLVRTWSTSVLTLSATAAHADEHGDTRGNADQDASDAAAGMNADPLVRVHSARGCRYCGGRLPDTRRVTFCPHCGLDLTKRQCPACSTELDANWRFCVTCGRGAETGEGLLQIARAAS